MRREEFARLEAMHDEQLRYLRAIESRGWWVTTSIIAALLAIVFIFALAKFAHAEQKTFEWDAPTTNVDGSPLTDLGGYELGYGNGTRNYTSVVDVGNVTKATREIPPGAFVAVRAYDTSGNRSVYSNELELPVSSPSPTATPTPSATPTVTCSTLAECQSKLRVLDAKYQAQVRLTGQCLRNLAECRK